MIYIDKEGSPYTYQCGLPPTTQRMYLLPRMWNHFLVFYCSFAAI